MKKNYTLKLAIVTVLLLVPLALLQAQANIRIIEVDPLTERVKIKNFGDASLDIGSYRFCALFDYGGGDRLNDMTILSGDLNLEPNAEVDIISSVSLNDTASDLGLYLGSGSFGSSSAMVDFLQWGNGGLGRESVAVSKGIWTAGTFLQVVPPYEYIGNGTQNGTAFWETLLSINDFETNGFKMFPNPSSDAFTLEFSRGISEGKIEVYNILGRQVFVQNLNPEFNEVDISQWASGMYLVKISSEGNSSVQRFIKN